MMGCHTPRERGMMFRSFLQALSATDTTLIGMAKTALHADPDDPETCRIIHTLFDHTQQKLDTARELLHELFPLDQEGRYETAENSRRY